MGLAEDKTAIELTTSTDNTSWMELIRQSNYNKALEELDSILNTNNFSVLERLWWIRCQLNLNLLPISTLVSPLEELSSQLLESKDNAALGISTYFKTGKVLLEKNQSRLSVLMLERALALFEKHKNISQEQYSELKELATKTLEAEIKNASDKKESIQYINSLEKKLENLKKTSKVKIQPEWTLDKKEPAIEETKKSAEPKKGYGKYIIAAILLLIGGYFATTKQSNSEAQIALSLPLPEAIPLQASISFNTKKSALSGVEERLASISEKSSSSDSSSSSSESEVDNKAIEEANKIPVPTEDEELVSINKDLNQKQEEQIPAAKIPSVDPKKVGATQVETVDQTPRRSGVTPSLPDIINNEPRIPEGTAMDGKPVQSYEVEVFDPPAVYNTIAATEVLSAPSLLSKSLARLETGTHVYVTKKMGLWLEIQSTGGRIGYIYAQDASQQ